MDIYNLTEVDTTMDGKRGVLLQGFQHHRRTRSASRDLLVRDSSGGRSRATAMLPVVRAAKLITPHVVS